MNECAMMIEAVCLSILFAEWIKDVPVANDQGIIQIVMNSEIRGGNLKLPS